MKPEKDEISKQAELAQLAVEDRAGKLFLILLASNFGAWLLHWFFGFPSSMSAVNAWSVVIALYIFLAAVRTFAGNFVAEYRLRSEHTAHQLAALEARITALGKSIEKHFTGAVRDEKQNE